MVDILHWGLFSLSKAKRTWGCPWLKRFPNLLQLHNPEKTKVCPRSLLISEELKFSVSEAPLLPNKPIHKFYPSPIHPHLQPRPHKKKKCLSKTFILKVRGSGQYKQQTDIPEPAFLLLFFNHPSSLLNQKLPLKPQTVTPTSSKIQPFPVTTSWRACPHLSRC